MVIRSVCSVVHNICPIIFSSLSIVFKLPTILVSEDVCPDGLVRDGNLRRRRRPSSRVISDFCNNNGDLVAPTGHAYRTIMHMYIHTHIHHSALYADEGKKKTGNCSRSQKWLACHAWRTPFNGGWWQIAFYSRDPNLVVVVVGVRMCTLRFHHNNNTTHMHTLSPM